MSTKLVIEKLNPFISIIIPSRDGDRRGNVSRIVSDLKKQTFQDFELIMAIGEKPNGHARNVGVSKAKGDLFLFIDDDAILGSFDMLEIVVKTFKEDENKEIGMVGCSTLLPLDSNPFQKRIAKEIERSVFPVVSVLTETDMAHHLFCAIPSSIWKEICGENAILETGTDMDLRYKIKAKNYKIVVAPNVFAYHPMPETFKQFCKQHFWYGTGTPILRHFWPNELKLDTLKQIVFFALKSVVSFPIRIFKFSRYSPVSFLFFKALAKFLSETGTIIGYFKYRQTLKKLAILYPDASQNPFQEFSFYKR
jgi:glycosyltransferase involved in cell wall biosynthesis